MIDILYVCKNRKQYVEHTFAALLDNTAWDEVDRLFIADDSSTDGTYQWLIKQTDLLTAKKIDYRFIRNFGGPVGAMNRYLDEAHDKNAAVDRFAKIDSDFIVCPSWLEEVLHQMTIHPGIDVFGLQPRTGPAQPPPFLTRTVEEARFIGGVGAIRHRVFELCRPRPSGPAGRFGWTEYQTAHDFKKCWLSPDLPAFCLDLLPFEPWISLAADYVAKGWMRAWPKYDVQSDSHWSWWTELDPTRRTDA